MQNLSDITMLVLSLNELRSDTPTEYTIITIYTYIPICKCGVSFISFIANELGKIIKMPEAKLKRFQKSSYLLF